VRNLRRRNVNGKRLASLVIAVVIVLISANIMSVSVKADTVEDMRDQYNQLEQESSKISKKLDNLKEKQEEQQAYADALESQIGTTQEQIDSLNSQISTLSAQIAEKEAEIEEKQGEIAERFDLLKKRLRAMYISGRFTDLEILLGAEDFAQYLSQSAMAESVARHDKVLMESIEDDIKKINKDKKAVKKDIALVTESREKLDDKKIQLNSQVKESNAVLVDLGKKEEKAKENYDHTRDSMEDLDAKIKEVLEEARKKKEERPPPPPPPAPPEDNDDNNDENDQGNSDPPPKEEPNPNGFIWPTPGHYQVWSGFGMRGDRMHNGIDISDAGIYGAEIVAAKTGYVVLSEWYYGYGNCVIIDHDEGYSTLYGHCSVLSASVGQYVNQGDVVAYVGSTGDSSGPHLHYEIQVNGIAQDPMNYY